MYYVPFFYESKEGHYQQITQYIAPMLLAVQARMCKELADAR
jgi:hypothetical protein